MREISEDFKFAVYRIVCVIESVARANCARGDALVSLFDLLDSVLLLGILMFTEEDLAISAAAENFADDVLIDFLMKLALVAILVVI